MKCYFNGNESGHPLDRTAAAQAIDRPARWGSPALLLIAARGSIWRPGWGCWRCWPGSGSRLALPLDQPGQLDQVHTHQQDRPAVPARLDQRQQQHGRSAAAQAIGRLPAKVALPRC